MLFVQVIVTVANLTKLEYIKSKCNLYIKTDVRLEDVKKNLYDVVILPGGPSHKRLADVSLYIILNDLI